MTRLLAATSTSTSVPSGLITASSVTTTVPYGSVKWRDSIWWLRLPFSVNTLMYSSSQVW